MIPIPILLSKTFIAEMHRIIVNSKTREDAAQSLGVSLRSLYRYLAHLLFNSDVLSYNELKALPEDLLDTIQVSPQPLTKKALRSFYSSSMIDALIKPLRGNLHDRANIKIADNLPIECVNVWCHFIKANYAHHDYLLLPFNSNNNHWVLVYINTANHFLAYIDPLGTPAPTYLSNGLDYLKNHEQISFNKPCISLITLQKDNYQCGPWLVLIMQTLLAGNMNYNSQSLASLLSPLKIYNIATARLIQQQCLASEMSIEPLLGKRPHSDSSPSSIDEEPKAKQRYAASSPSQFVSELTNDDMSISLDEEAQTQNLFAFFIKAVNREPKPTDSNGQLTTRSSNGFFALSDSLPRVDVDLTDDKLTVTVVDFDDDTLYLSCS